MAQIGDFTGLAGDLVDVSRSEGVSGIGTFANNRSSVTRVYQLGGNDLLNIDDHYKYVQHFLGYSSISTSVDGTKFISRRLPHSINLYRRLTDNLHCLYATKVDVKPYGPSGYVTKEDGNVFPDYKHIQFTVTYESLPYEIVDDNAIKPTGGVTPDESTWKRYVMKVAKPAGQFVTLNAGMYKYVAGAATTFGISRLLLFCNLQITWYQVPETAVPSLFVNPNLIATNTLGALDNTIGKVNSVAFNGFPAGTLLLLGASLQPYRSAFGDRIFDVQYVFKYFNPTAPTSNTGHNWILKPTNGVWTEVTTSGATNLVAHAPSVSIYDWADFSLLFKVPT